MVRILLRLLSAHQGSSSLAVVPVGDVEARHLGKFSRDGLDVLIIADNPELVAKAIDWGDEIILRFCSRIAHQNFIEHGIIRISEEDWFDVGIADTNVLHAVLFLVTAGELMLLDDARHVIIHVGTYHQTILGLAIHGLGIDVILFLIILLQPAVFLELFEVLCCAFVNARVILRSTWLEVDFRFDDMIKTLLVIASFRTSFLGVEDIIRTRLHLLHELLRWTNTLERFYYCHN